MPSMPTSARASFTSSSLNGLIIASNFFIFCGSPARIWPEIRCDAGSPTGELQSNPRSISNLDANLSNVLKPSVFGIFCWFLCPNQFFNANQLAAFSQCVDFCARISFIRQSTVSPRKSPFGGEPRQITMSKGKRGKKRFPKPLQSPDSAPESPIDQSTPEHPPETESPEKAHSFFRRCDWIAFALATLISFGVYFYTLIAGEFTDTRKMVILK